MWISFSQKIGLIINVTEKSILFYYRFTSLKFVLPKMYEVNGGLVRFVCLRCKFDQSYDTDLTMIKGACITLHYVISYANYTYSDNGASTKSFKFSECELKKVSSQKFFEGISVCEWILKVGGQWTAILDGHTANWLKFHKTLFEKWNFQTISCE